MRILGELARWCFVLDVGSGVCEGCWVLNNASDSNARDTVTTQRLATALANKNFANVKRNSG